MRLQEGRIGAGMVLFNLFFSAVLFFFLVNVMLFASAFSASERLECPSFQIARIMLYGNSGPCGADSVSGRLAILDTSGGEVAVIERSWAGFYLSMEFLQADFYGKKYYFPYRVKGTDVIMESRAVFGKKRGTYLYPYFIEGGRCLLFGGNGESDQYVQRELFKIARVAKNPAARCLSKISGHIEVNLSHCESGVHYGVFIDEKGNLSLARE